MQKAILLGLVAMSALTCEAQKSKVPYWLDPAMNRVGVQAPRSDFFAFESIDAAQHGDKKQSSRYMSLEGKWKFYFVKNHNEAPKRPGRDPHQRRGIYRNHRQRGHQLLRRERHGSAVEDRRPGPPAEAGVYGKGRKGLL